MPSGWAQQVRKLVNFEELLKYASVQRWYMKRRESARKGALYRLAAYLRWRESRGLGTDMDKLVEECLDGTNRVMIRHLQELKDWVEGEALDGCDYETRRKYYNEVRGFYKANLIPLPSSPISVSKTNSVVKVNVTATQFLEMASQVVNSSGLKPRDRAIIMTMIQSGMDASTLCKCFNFVGFPQLVKHFGSEDWSTWDERKVPVRIDMVRPKTGYAYYSFLDKDAVTTLKTWLNVRASKFGRLVINRSADPRQLPTSEPIFVVDAGKPIRPEYVSLLFKEAGVAAGVNVVPHERMQRYTGSKRRYPFHSHEVRDTLITLGRSRGIDVSIVNFFVGHNIDNQGYDKSPWDTPEEFAREYSKISRYLNLISDKEAKLKDTYERKITEEIERREKTIQKLIETQERLDQKQRELERLIREMRGD